MFLTNIRVKILASNQYFPQANTHYKKQIQSLIEGQ